MFKWVGLGLFLLLTGCSSVIVTEAVNGKFTVDGVPDPGYVLHHGGQVRSYFLHLPKDYDDRKDYPLVVVLHSAMGNGSLIAERTHFNDLADTSGFIVAYPNGTGDSDGAMRMLTWNSGHCCYLARERAVDDVGFITQLLEQLQQRYSVNPNRIHITGFSNGAMLAYRLGAVLSGQVASIAAVSGNIGGQIYDSAPQQQIPEPEYPLSVLAIHGMKDEQVPYGGGRGKKTIGTRMDISVPDSLAFWRRANRCPQEPDAESVPSLEVHHELYSCQTTATDVELYALIDGGHAWPGGESVEGWSMEKMVIRILLDAPSSALDASQVIWHFFESHPLPPKMQAMRSEQ